MDSTSEQWTNLQRAHLEIFADVALTLTQNTTGATQHQGPNHQGPVVTNYSEASYNNYTTPCTYSGSTEFQAPTLVATPYSQPCTESTKTMHGSPYVRLQEQEPPTKSRIIQHSRLPYEGHVFTPGFPYERYAPFTSEWK